jgi:signal transduction histidine kinase
MELHSLLRRQIKRAFGEAQLPDAMGTFLKAIDETYRQFDRDQDLLERSLDISSRELYEVNLDLRAARDAAEAAAKVKRQFLAVMSHEIRTPMNAVIGMTQLLMDTEVSAEQRESLRIMRDAEESLMSLIDDILDFSRIENGQVRLEQRPFDCRRCVHSTADLLLLAARQKGLTLRCSVASSFPAMVCGDEARIRQVLLNLIGNAIKFTVRGEIEVSADAIPREDGQYEITFAVRDTGIGIPADRLQSIFQVFSQVDSSSKRRFGGAGIGLAISTSLCELMGGRIWAESETGKGSTFRFSILASPATPPAPAAGARRHECLACTHPKSVLIAEDHPVNQLITARLLRRMGYLPDVAANGVEALEAWRVKRYDTIFMDMHMPEMDGIECTRRIRAMEDGLADKTRIVALTASVQEEDRRACLAAGMDEYLTKPVHGDELRAALER